MGKGKAMVFNHGLMEPNIKVSGITIKLQGKANSLTPMEIRMKENSKMIRLMDMVYSFIKIQVLGMKVTGKMTCSMAQEYKVILIKIDMKGCTKKAENMEKELITLKMELYTRVNGSMVKSKGMVSARGWMAVDTRDSGQQIKGMEKESFIGLMVVHTLEITKMIKDMEKAPINGVMEESM